MSHWAPTPARARPLACLSAQAAKTYLEKHYESFSKASLDELVRHGLKALAGSLSDGKLTPSNTAVAVVGKDLTFTVLENDAIAPYLTALEEEEGSMAVEAPPAQVVAAAEAADQVPAAGPPSAEEQAAAAAAAAQIQQAEQQHEAAGPEPMEQ